MFKVAPFNVNIALVWTELFPLRLMDDLITKCTFMTLRWTLWLILTSSLVDRPVVSHILKTVKGTCGVLLLFVSFLPWSFHTLQFPSVFQAAFSGNRAQWPVSCVYLLGWERTTSFCLWDGAGQLWIIIVNLLGCGKDCCSLKSTLQYAPLCNPFGFKWEPGGRYVAHW